MRKLVQFSNWYRDEFNVVGFRVMDNKEYEDMMNTITEIRKIMNDENYPFIELYFGTNEYFEIAIDELMDCLEVTDISEQQAEMLTYFFGAEYGYWPLPALEDWLHDRIIERDIE